MLSITLDLESGTPPYEQLRNQISGLIHAGILVSGTQLPAARTLASDLGVAPNTVARAYRELATDGLVTSRRRAGTVVRVLEAKLAEATSVHLAKFVSDAHADGLTDAQILDCVRGALQSREQPQPINEPAR